MFSGIVEECATLVAMVRDQENVHFTFKCSFVNELKIDRAYLIMAYALRLSA